MNPRIIEPGGTIGVFGGGQLGRMFTMVAARLGYRVVIFTPELNSPASQVAHETIQADYEDPSAVRRFAESVDVVTLEFENISVDALERACEHVPVRPGPHVLRVAQQRIVEKSTLRKNGFPVTPFLAIESESDVDMAAKQFGWPMVLKTASWGYDGKGQRKVSSVREAHDAWQMLGPSPVIAEKWIPFEREVSILVARNELGEIATYPVVQNEHSNHILDLSKSPLLSEQDKCLCDAAEEIGRGVVDALDCCGLLCIEFFVVDDGSLLINELAPRPHNSGHLTIESNQTSQFEQQLRAVCNLPMGKTDIKRPAAMANLLGEVWNCGAPKFHLAMKQSETFLHLYGKSDPRPGRKMGHLTCLDESADAAAERALLIRDQLAQRTHRLPGM